MVAVFLFDLKNITAFLWNGVKLADPLGLFHCVGFLGRLLFGA